MNSKSLFAAALSVAAMGSALGGATVVRSPVADWPMPEELRYQRPKNHPKPKGHAELRAKRKRERQARKRNRK